MAFNNPLGHLSWVSKSITTQSALNPILWLCGICVPGALTTLLFANPNAFWIGIALVFPVFVAAFSYIALLMLAPDRLHSEKYQLDLRKLQMLGDDRAGPISIDEKAVSNPAVEATHE